MAGIDYRYTKALATIDSLIAMIEERTMTAQQLAQAYVETICGPANGWGQHVHPVLGRSDYIMLRIRKMVGESECDRLIDEAFDARQYQLWLEEEPR